MPQAVHARTTRITDEDADDDAVLVAHAKCDPRAFAPLYQRYVDRVYRYCDRCLGRRDLAEDATSLIFTKALAALPSCQDERFRAWLFAIAHNVVVDAHRRQARYISLADAADFEDQDAANAPELQALASDDRRAIHVLLAQLSQDQRHLLELRLAGLTDAEIARVLGRSHVAVRTSQHRALLRLRALVANESSAREVSDGSH